MPPKKRSVATTSSISSRLKTTLTVKTQQRKRSKQPDTRKTTPSATPTPPRLTGPLPTLILDTGGWNIKHSLVCPRNHPGDASIINTDSRGNLEPSLSPNVSAKPRHQLATLLSSQIHSIQNKSQLSVTRPIERGYVTDLGTQFQIWDFILKVEKLEARHSFSRGGASGVMPSSAVGSKSHIPGGDKNEKDDMKSIFTHTAAVFCLCQPFTPRCILEREDEVWFRDFGFGRVGRRLGACCSAYKYLKDGKKDQDSCYIGGTTDRWNKDMPDDETGCCCVIDCGFSMTWIVPTVDAYAIRKGIRRIQVGGKLMTNLLKQTISYRKFNMMDEFYIINEAKESLCFVSMNFEKEMRKARSIPEGRRWFDREFVLPDFVETFHGSVRLPETLKMLRSKSFQDENIHKGNQIESKALEITSDGDGKKDETTHDSQVDNASHHDSMDHEEEEFSDEETQEQAKKRILEQREQDRRRREKEDMDRQALCLSVERFSVPEVLFRPSDIGMNQLGIADAIVQSIESCDPIYRPALYQNIILTGGNAKIPNLKERLEVELRSVAPSDVNIRIYLPNNPDSYAWDGAKALVQDNDLKGSNIYLDRADWELRQSKGEAAGDIWKTTLNSNLPDDLTVI